MDKKFVLRCFIFFVAIAVASVMLPSCYEIKTEVLGPGEGIRVVDLPDGTYINEEKEQIKIKWEEAAKEYSLAMISKEGTTLCRVRVAPLHDSYLVVQLYNDKEEVPYVLLFVTTGQKEIVVHLPKDSKQENQLALKTGVATKTEDFWKEVKTAKAQNLRAFMKEVAASGMLKASARYQYQEAGK